MLFNLIFVLDLTIFLFISFDCEITSLFLESKSLLENYYEKINFTYFLSVDVPSIHHNVIIVDKINY